MDELQGADAAEIVKLVGTKEACAKAADILSVGQLYQKDDADLFRYRLSVYARNHVAVARHLGQLPAT